MSSIKHLPATTLPPHPHPSQVELNTVASSFGCLSTLVARMHRYLLGRLGASSAELAALPEHNAMDAIVDAMSAAAAYYGTPGGVMVMVVQPGERNAYDQQWLQTRLWERHGVRTLRRSLAQVGGGELWWFVGWAGSTGAVVPCSSLVGRVLACAGMVRCVAVVKQPCLAPLLLPTQIAAEGKLGPDGRLTIGGHPVAIVYFRAGYTPTDYPTETEWDARVLVEQCDAYKCPTVAYQLAGAKKIQQVPRAGLAVVVVVGAAGWEAAGRNAKDGSAGALGLASCEADWGLLGCQHS